MSEPNKTTQSQPPSQQGTQPSAEEKMEVDEEVN